MKRKKFTADVYGNDEGQLLVASSPWAFLLDERDRILRHIPRSRISTQGFVLLLEGVEAEEYTDMDGESRCSIHALAMQELCLITTLAQGGPSTRNMARSMGKSEAWVRVMKQRMVAKGLLWPGWVKRAA